MKLLGLTGGVGMGKSTAARFFEELGLPVVDTDRLAHELTAPGQPALQQIIQHFGSQFLHADGTLNRRALAEKIFTDTAARKTLENILHPLIRAAWKTTVQHWQNAGLQRAVVVIPLLYETGAEREVDRVACVACSFKTQAARLTARGWPESHWRQRIAAQMPIEEKINRAHFVIWSEGSLAVHRAQIERLLRHL